MFHRAKFVVLTAGLVVFACTIAATADESSTKVKKVTLSGVAKALGDPKAKMDPAVANATLTVSKGGEKTVYQVYGWAGVILAMKADGKKAEVSGVIGAKNGKKTVTGRSVDVKVIVVEEQSSEN